MNFFVQNREREINSQLTHIWKAIQMVISPHLTPTSSLSTSMDEYVPIHVYLLYMYVCAYLSMYVYEIYISTYIYIYISMCRDVCIEQVVCRRGSLDLECTYMSEAYDRGREERSE